MKKILALTTAFLLGSSALASPAQDLFDEVSYYLVLNYGGASTADVRGLPDKYQLQLEAACMTMLNTCPTDKAFPVINSMLGELNDEHTGFYPNLASQVKDLIAGNSSAISLGLRLAYFEKTVFIRTVHAASAAAKAGVRRADQITHLNFAAINSRTFDTNWDEINTKGGYITFSRQGESFRTRLIPSKLEPELPSLQMRSDGIGVLKIPDFFGRGQGSIANQVHSLVSQAKNPKGIILELRDNPGGFVADCTGVAAAFLENARNNFIARTAFGSAYFFFRDNKIWQRRNNTESSLINLVSATRYTGKVVLLQNSGSASCSEFLASNLQEAKRAIILGEPSAGVANTSVGFFLLSDQSALQLSLNTRVDSSNTRYAATVTPNEIISDDLIGLNTTGQDPIFERALEILNAP
jgi:carboxyl-terminal processing protease